MPMDDDLDPRSLVHKPPEPPKIGDTIYRFDTNHRVYRTPGAFGGGPIYSAHFVPHKIIGESGQSWQLEFSGKVGKRVLLAPGPAKAWFTEQQKMDNIWVNDHGHRIRQALQHATADQLRQVAAIIGYDPEQQ